MTAVQWCEAVNTRFYDKIDTPPDNAVITEYASGRKAVVLRNTRWGEHFTVKLSLHCKAETAAFWQWYKYTLGGLAGIFTCGALGDDKTWRFTKTPQDGGGIPYREFSLEIEEAF